MKIGPSLATTPLLCWLLLSSQPAGAVTGGCTSYDEPAASSYIANSSTEGRTVSPKNATGPAIGWAAASLPVALPLPSAVASNWTMCFTSDNNKAAVLSAPSLAAPTTPGLSQTPGGSISPTTYYVKITYVNAAGETVGSSEASLAVGGSNLLVVGSPTSSGNATGWNIYASTSTGTETKQNVSGPIAIGTGWTEPLGGLISGAALPSTATATAAYILSGGLSLGSLTIGPGNYEFATVQSDGSNFRVISASPATTRAAQTNTGNPPGRYVYPGGPGYAVTGADNGNVISADATASGLAITLPNISTLAVGWAADVVGTLKGGSITVNGSASEKLVLPNGGSVTSYTFSKGNYVGLKFNGANFELSSHEDPPISYTLTATGTNQGTAAPVRPGETVVNNVAPGTGLVLVDDLNRPSHVLNRGLNPLNVYPFVGAQIEAFGNNNPVTLDINRDATFFCPTITQCFESYQPLAPGRLVMVPPINTSNHDGTVFWRYLTPDGSSIPGISATHTSGFNEAEDWAFAHGWSLVIQGPGETQGALNDVYMSAWTSGYVMHPLAQRSLTLDGALLQCKHTINGPCLEIDSMIEGAIFCKACQIGAEPDAATVNSVTVYLHPRNPTPVEGSTGINNSYIELGNLAMNPSSVSTAGSVVAADTTSGPISTNKIRIIEANGFGTTFYAFAAYGIETNGHPFAANQISGVEFHGGVAAAILDGASSTNNTLIAGNSYKISTLNGGQNGHAGTYLIATRGVGETFDIGIGNNAEGSFNHAVKTYAGAVGNSFTFQRLSGALGSAGLNPGIDEGAGWLNNYKINGSILNEISGLDPNTLTASVVHNFLEPHTPSAGVVLYSPDGRVNTNYKQSVKHVGGTNNFVVELSIPHIPLWRCTAISNNQTVGIVTQNAGNSSAVGFVANATIPANTLFDVTCE